MRAKDRLRKKLQTYQRFTKPALGILGNHENEVIVPDRTNFVYVRLSNREVVEVYNSKVTPLAGLRVKVGYDENNPTLLQVLDARIENARYGDFNEGVYSIGPHHLTHEYLAENGGSDVVYVQGRQFMPLRPTPSDTDVSLHLYRSMGYLGTPDLIAFSGVYLDLDEYVPNTGCRFVLVYQDHSGMPGVMTGTVHDFSDITLDKVPKPRPGMMPIASVLLYQGQEKVYEGRSVTDIVDLRFPQAMSFLGLFDTPISYTGTAGKFPYVKMTEDGLGFAEIGGNINQAIGMISPMVNVGDMIYQAGTSFVNGNLAVYANGVRAYASTEGIDYREQPAYAKYVLQSDVSWDAWEQNYWTSSLTDPIDDSYVYVDLLAAYSIQAVRLKFVPNYVSPEWFNESGYFDPGIPKSVDLYTSNNGTVWTLQENIPLGNSPEYYNYWYVLSQPLTARYFKFMCHEPRYVMEPDWSIFNVGLYQGTSTAGPARLAVGLENQILGIHNGLPSWGYTQFPFYDGTSFYLTGTALSFGDGFRMSTTGTVGPAGGEIGKTVVVDLDASFLQLNDSPNSYSGQAYKYVRVNGTANALEFASGTAGSGGSGWSEGCNVYNNANLLITGSANIELPFNTERYDSNGLHSTTVNPTRLTCKTTGVYSISGHVRWDTETGSNVGSRSLAIVKNGTTNIAVQRQQALSAAAQAFGMSVSRANYPLVAGDYVELRVYQDSGNILTISYTPDQSPEFGMTRVG